MGGGDGWVGVGVGGSVNFTPSFLCSILQKEKVQQIFCGEGNVYRRRLSERGDGLGKAGALNNFFVSNCGGIKARRQQTGGREGGQGRGEEVEVEVEKETLHIKAN